MKQFTMEQFATHLYREAESLEGSLIRAEAQTLADVTRNAHEMSHGIYSTAHLTRLGHPYAVAHPDPPADEAIINYQKGNFDRGWEGAPPTSDGDKITAELRNDSREAAFMDGTALMIRRPIVERLSQGLADIHETRAADTLLDALAGEKE